MCGIIGILGTESVAGGLIEALKRLEYRGYDSAGVATVEPSGALGRRRAPGKIVNLEGELAVEPLVGSAGIGHTRWATHGAPTRSNAHPHANSQVAIVHNGIIENFRTLRERLIAKGYVFESETDSEVIAHLIMDYMKAGLEPIAAGEKAVSELEGAFALACIFAGEQDLMFGARRGSPLVVGVGQGTMYLGSDAIAVAPFTQTVIYLDEGDSVAIRRTSVAVKDHHGRRVQRDSVTVAGAAAAEKGNHRHFMQKEIYEQPETIGRTISRYFNAYSETVALPDFSGLDLSSINQMFLVACGTAHYASRVAEYWLEQIAGVSVKSDIASEFRYRRPVLPPRSAAMFISQSGETADTLAALRYAKDAGLPTLAVLNVPQSTMWREAGAVLPTLAGPEIGVASTKAFTAQLTALAAFTIAMARARGAIDATEEMRLAHALLETPRLVAEALACESQIEALAADIAKATGALFLGRGVFYPLALEGALKLKEISYLHAEGYASGELKHGPIALVDQDMPVIVLAPKDALFEKTMSNVEEVAARGGRIVLISDRAGHEASAHLKVQRIALPTCDPICAPIVASVPVQLIAYQVAVHKGTDVDQPRNLAKSVTVE
jgi:glucosamine--fructose-6-phosphate aminotransferase (isomerizing)